MAIIGIEGGIGTGKTLTGVWYIIGDLRAGKRIFTNVKLKGLTREEQSRVKYLIKDEIKQMFELVKTGKMSMKNSTIFLQEIHNYLDSRGSMTANNRLLSYWILQSRHAGQGSCDIIFDTQELGQVDKRLRNNTDYLIRPLIVGYDTVDKKDARGHPDQDDEKKGKQIPKIIVLIGRTKLRHKWIDFKQTIDVSETREMYDTHELVDF